MNKPGGKLIVTQISEATVCEPIKQYATRTTSDPATTWSTPPSRVQFDIHVTKRKRQLKRIGSQPGRHPFFPTGQDSDSRVPPKTQGKATGVIRISGTVNGQTRRSFGRRAIRRDGILLKLNHPGFACAYVYVHASALVSKRSALRLGGAGMRPPIQFAPFNRTVVC